MNKNYKGIWFYGLSGSGKTYISKAISKKVSNTILVDGDNVRKLVSYDLGYSKKDREVQINRIFGICKIIIYSKKIPIASSVYFNNELNLKCKKIGILPIKIERKNFHKIIKTHKTYKNNKNVVGKDISYSKLKTSILVNDNTINFKKNIKIFIKKIKIKKK